MGCNSSKQEDIRVDRERQRRQNARKPGSKPQTANQSNPSIHQSSNPLEEPLRSSTDINSSSFSPQTNVPAGNLSNADDDSGIYGTSYTNRRAKEFDLLNQIIKQTRENFIDVSAKVQTLDDEDRVERSTLYAKSMKQSNNQSSSQSSQSINQSNQSNNQSHSSWRPQPSPSVSSIQSMAEILRSAREHPINQSMIIDASKQMSESILNVSITVPEPFVMTFEELIARTPKRPITNQQVNNQPMRTVQIA